MIESLSAFEAVATIDFPITTRTQTLVTHRTIEPIMALAPARSVCRIPGSQDVMFHATQCGDTASV
eukprot:6208347-Amphidinium_carterae.1